MKEVLLVTRRRFLKTTGFALAAGAAPLPSAPFVSRAMAETKTLSIVQWATSSPRTTTGSTNSPRIGARRTRSRSPWTTSPCRTFRRARPRKRRRDRATTVRFQRRRRRASLPQVPHGRLRPREGDREEVRQGEHDRQAARLQRGRRHLVGVPRLLHQFPGHVPQEHVGRDRHDAGYLGQPAQGRRQAEGKRSSGRHLARPQQRPEHDVARPAVELRRVDPGRGRQEGRSQQQGDGRGRSTSPHSTRKR